MILKSHKADWPSATFGGSALLSACDNHKSANDNNPDDIFVAIKADLAAIDIDLARSHAAHNGLIMRALCVSTIMACALAVMAVL